MSRPPQLMITYVDMPLRRVSQVGPLKVLTYPAVHTNETNSTSLRVEVASKVIAYTGDSEWTEHMPALAEAADLFIAVEGHVNGSGWTKATLI